MIKNLRKIIQRNAYTISNRSFLTFEYKCQESWNNVKSLPLFKKIVLNDFYNQLDQNHASKGVISAIDVDLFAHALKDDSSHLEELKELLHKLRLSAETGNMLESTHNATIRNFMNMGHTQELIEILKDPLNFGIFLDNITANMLLDELLVDQKYDLAAEVASLVMLQEDYSNELTNVLCQYAAYKYIENYSPPEPKPPVDKKIKVEEIKIRIKFLRNPYYDDHFDIKDTITKCGKTLAWLSEIKSDNLNINLQILGWYIYNKYDKLLELSQTLSKSSSFKIYQEVLDIMKKETVNCTEDEKSKENIDQCLKILSNIEIVPTSLEQAIKTAIENAINKVHTKDVEMQQKLFKSWVEIREQKLEEQTKRLDRAKRLQLIQHKQEELKEEEQKLWFFENEDQIDLEIEEKEKLESPDNIKKGITKNDEDYIPPEILPKRK